MYSSTTPRCCPNPWGANGQHPGLGFVSAPRTDVYVPYFAAAAQRNNIDDAWLRAVAHAKSAFRANAVSRKGAQGVTQLMPATSTAYEVKNPFSPRESIGAGAKLLANLLERYDGDRRLATAAYDHEAKKDLTRITRI